jgi:glycosyltransferase involved in cell wall biosynthesis
MEFARTTPGYRKLSVLMPVYNEVRTLRTVVRRVLTAPIELPLELVIVDDGSTDGSREVIAALAATDVRIRSICHDKNQGKTAAIRTAIANMTGDLALIQDADLEYNPRDYPALLRPMLDGIADAVFGSRFLAGTHRRALYFWHTVANKLLTLVCNVLNDINLTDMETGYKLIRADVLKAIPLTSAGFALEPELATKLTQWDLRIYEVPISYEGRTHAEGKKIRAKDALQALWAMLKYRFFVHDFTRHEGFQILQSVRQASRFNQWLTQQILPFVGQRVLEAGCGIGNLTQFFLDRQRLVCVDNDPLYVECLGRRFGHLENVAVQNVDLERVDEYPDLAKESLDTVICINVLEHLVDDDRVLRGFFEALAPGGHAIILVPAHPALYTAVDRALGHQRRYRAATLQARLREAGFAVVSCRGFNRLGSLGWFVSGNLLRRKTLSAGQMKAYERMLPVAKCLEHLPLLPHLSWIAVGRKPDDLAQRRLLRPAA